jgi:hypothetical protein
VLLNIEDVDTVGYVTTNAHQSTTVSRMNFLHLEADAQRIYIESCESISKCVTYTYNRMYSNWFVVRKKNKMLPYRTLEIYIIIEATQGDRPEIETVSTSETSVLFCQTTQSLLHTLIVH